MAFLSAATKDDKGWISEIFEEYNDPQLLSDILCPNCNAVCRDAVELGCSHDDDEIYPYCNICLSERVHNDKCHLNPTHNAIINPNRSLRRIILQSLIVTCPHRRFKCQWTGSLEQLQKHLDECNMITSISNLLVAPKSELVRVPLLYPSTAKKIVCGYIHQMELKCKPMIVPPVIISITQMYYVSNKLFINKINCKLNDFIHLGPVIGARFSSTSMVKDPQTNKTYFLKKIHKKNVDSKHVLRGQHVRNEVVILSNLDSKFCAQLCGIYSDQFSVYLLVNKVLGGELFTVFKWNGKFKETTARFYAACVVCAFEAMHSLNIIYRFLSPERMLICRNGYIKLIDFTFAKYINNSKTYCGVAEYMAPEVIQHYTQTTACDWWSLGILVYELVTGESPFKAHDKVTMTRKILTYAVEYPSEPYLTDKCKAIINGLLTKQPSLRLGAAGTKKILTNSWFKGIDWKEMREQKMFAPYIPNIQNDEDISHYDDFSDDSDDSDDDNLIHDWCADF